MTSSLRTVCKRGRLATLALAVAIVPLAAGPADAATKHRRAKAKRTVVATTVAPKRKATKPTARVASPAPSVAVAPAPAPTAAPVVNSVISIGGYVFYGLTYAQAVEAYAAAVAAAPPGYTPPPVTSISIDTTVGGTVS